MSPRLRITARMSLLAVLLTTFALVPTIALADEEDRLYDFTDAYYLANGVNPAAIDGRRQADGILAVTDETFFSFQRPVRSLLTLPAYDHSGNLEFFTVHGGLSANAFTNNAAGRQARQLADRSIEYVFPQQGTDPLGLGSSPVRDSGHGQRLLQQ